MATSGDPPLLRLCRTPYALETAHPDAAKAIEKALIDLAIATTAVRRSHRLTRADKLNYVYHYTSFETFEGVFPEVKSAGYRPPSLLLSPTELLNDPNEGAYFFSSLAEHADTDGLDGLAAKLLEYRRTMRNEDGLSATDPLVFVASLCIEHDNLNLWRFYGGAQGVSFGIHESQFDLSSEEGISDDYSQPDKLYRVKYGEAAANAALTHLAPALHNLVLAYHKPTSMAFRPHIVRSMAGLLGSVAYLFKDVSYEAEKECRLLRIQSVADLRAGRDWQSIGGVVRAKSRVEFLHGGSAPPRVTLGPQFDVNNPERGQTRAIDRMRVAIENRAPEVRLSKMKYRIPDKGF